MNTPLFNQAKTAYAAGKYEEALQALTSCLEDTYLVPQPGEVGLLYHQIGNCVVKLGNHSEAIKAYSQATADNAYGACGSVNYNLGMAYAALGDYEDAISHFEIAVSDGKYDAPHKAYMAMGNALMKLGKSAEAGIAFRSAALDAHNTNPVRALLNLGVCFMALNRPNDAVVSYESALQFDMDPALKNKLYANLGQAYVASGKMQKACQAFEQALEDKTYFLSDSASVDYQRAVGAVAQGTMDMGEPVAVDEKPAAADEPASDSSGLDVIDGHAVEQDGAMAQAERPYGRREEGYDDGFDTKYDFNGEGEEEDPKAAKAAAKEAKKGRKGKKAQADFFDTTGQTDQWAQLSNAAPKKRRIGLKIAVFLMVLLIAALGAGIYLYSQGWGYPPAEDVVTSLFADPDEAVKTLYAEGINEATATQLSKQVQQDKSVTIDGVNRTMSTTEVYATTTMTEGARITYRITLIRDMLSWKISNVEVYHPSQQ